ncbi:glycosyltransferase family 2 protein [Paraburkholderia unamae]|uniref:Glycosyl transferase family 2 n=1 Tax=Paraburkholderia unamae TaxID=219649 RepID=A0ABX5KZU7_9BURK|nr:glycosyltransferase family 2 protein [Paraburkholderia unamae]PVX97340.1 glycosyl transferase family 2 [Paraburkholderia unamae]CAG9256035.1 Glyco_trans_2-like domain-containing protein [Paraburkholderia unamae]
MSPTSAAGASAPCVSVVTPTWNREAFLPLAYRSFASQRALALEWIVIDDSEAPSAYMASLRDERVVYRHLPTRLSIGEKRNLAAELARGEIIAHFDDDEIYAPDYLGAMLGQMRRHEAQLVKLGAFFLYSRVYGQFAYWDLMRKSGLHFCWSDRPMTALNFPHENAAFADNHLGYGFSYLYTKRLWASQPFEHRSFNEDGMFATAARARGARIALPTDDVGLCLHVLHAHNTSKCFPQYLLPDVLVARQYPHFCEALDAASLRAS